MPRYETGHFIANVARPSQQRTPPSTSTALDVSSISLIAVGEVDPGMAVLAQPLACLVGRDHERCAVGELLVVRRLVTLCGPGGVGKTRLALAVVQEVADWLAAGALVVELAGVSDPLAVAATVATALGVPETASGGPLEALLAVLAHRELLVVLDNCEHVIDAVGELVTALLTRTTAIRVLATSREPLGVSGEAVFRLDPLPIPDTMVAGAGDALTLFIARAREANHRFAIPDSDASAAVELVRRLDGLPLAIELVAAHAAALNTVELLERLDDSHQGLLDARKRSTTRRHRSLRAAIEWSDGLLTDRERTVFYRLSVFAGGWTLDAAELVGASPGDLSAMEVTDAAAALVDKSLVVARASPEGTRHFLLDTVRHYTAERLAASGDPEALRGAHLAWLLELTGHAASELDRPDRSVWAGRLDREIDNLRTGLDWAIVHDPPAALVLATRLGRWWRTVGRLAEGRRWLEATLAANISEPPSQVAPALVELGGIIHDQGDVVASHTTHRRALAAAECCADEDMRTRAALGMAWALRDSGNYAEASGFAQRALRLARDRGDHPGEARALAVLAFVAVLRGAFDDAHKLGEQAVRVCSDTDTGDGAWDALAAATVGSSFAGALDVAEAHGSRLLALAERRGNRVELAWAQMMLGAIAGMRGDAVRAINYCRRSLALAVEIGSTRALVNALMGLVQATGLTEGYDLGATLAGAATGVLRRAGFALPRGFDRYLRLDSYARSFGIDPAPLEPAYEHGKTLTTSDAVELAYTVVAPGDDPPAGTGAVDRISPRERQLIGLVAGGLTDAQIAERLSISVRTVRSHLDRIRNKTGARRRADLTRLAVTSGLIRQ